jgi:hypothetical protein
MTLVLQILKFSSLMPVSLPFLCKSRLHVTVYVQPSLCMQPVLISCTLKLSDNRTVSLLSQCIKCSVIVASFVCHILNFVFRISCHLFLNVNTWTFCSCKLLYASKFPIQIFTFEYVASIWSPTAVDSDPYSSRNVTTFSASVPSLDPYKNAYDIPYLLE